MATDPRDLYLDLLKKALTCSLYEGLGGTHWAPKPRKWKWRFVLRHLLPADAWVMRPVDEATRRAGRDWPALAQTMVGLDNLDHLQRCVETVLTERVPGDLVETGVWRGGASILMRGVLAAHGVTDRVVWVADSFRGVPPPDAARYPADAADVLHAHDALAVSRERVEANFRRYGLLDDRVRFLEGWFSETLPRAPIERLALLRLDGDLYESTMDSLTHLHPRLSRGGFVIVDDYGAVPACARAVEDFRAREGIRTPLTRTGHSAISWRRE